MIHPTCEMSVGDLIKDLSRFDRELKIKMQYYFYDADETIIETTHVNCNSHKEMCEKDGDCVVLYFYGSSW